MNYKVLLILTCLALAPIKAALAQQSLIIMTADEKEFVYSFENSRVQLLHESKLQIREELIHSPLDQVWAPQHLVEAPDREALAVAYIHALFECEDADTNLDLRNQWIRQLTEELQTDAEKYTDLTVRSISADLVIISGRDEQQPVVLNRKTGRRLQGSPCGIENIFFRISPDKQRLAVASEPLGTLDFKVLAGRLQYMNSKPTGMATVLVINLKEPKASIISIKDVNRPVDIRVSDFGGLQLISARDYVRWSDPENWLLAIAGHQKQLSDVFLKTFNSSGNRVGEHLILKGISFSYARFLRQ